jgi:FkbM family methyltransferase
MKKFIKNILFKLQIKYHAQYPALCYLGNNNVLLKTLFGNKLIVDANNTDIVPTLLMNKCWEPDVSRLILSVLPSKANILDLGANIGYFTTLMASRTNGCIFSFEANPTTFKYLERNVQISGNLFKIKLYNKAVYNSNSQITFYAVKNNQGCSSVVYNDVLEYFHDIQNEIVVDCIKIDDLDINNIGFIKMDIEGAEYKALQGMINLLKTCKPMIVTEINHAKLDAVEKEHNSKYKLFNLLWNMGYQSYWISSKLIKIDSLSTIPDLPDFDVLFTFHKP